MDAKRLGLIGFSAGGNLAAKASTQFEQRSYSAVDEIDRQSCRPDFAVLVYPAYLDNRAGQISPDLNLKADIPPTLIVHSEDDKSFVLGSKLYHAALKQAKVKHEFKLYPTGGHGYGLRSTRDARAWPDDALHWLRETGFLTGKKIVSNIGTAQRAKPTSPQIPAPTFAEVAYGEHERQVLDFWQAPSEQPTPLVFYLHGGAWSGGDKRGSSKLDVAKYLAAGISVVSINYRFVRQAQAAGVKPPVEWPMHDAKRALQFVRSKAAEWNLNKERIAASGTSAGACTSLWLAFHDDMADLNSSDPVARESTRLWCAAVHGAQTSLDPQQMKEWISNSRYGGHAFGIRGKSEAQFAREPQGSRT